MKYVRVREGKHDKGIPDWLRYGIIEGPAADGNGGLYVRHGLRRRRVWMPYELAISTRLVVYLHWIEGAFRTFR